MSDDKKKKDPKALAGYTRELRKEALRTGQAWLPANTAELRFWELQTMIASLRGQKRHCESKIAELQKKLEQNPGGELELELRYHQTWRKRCEILLHAFITPTPAARKEQK
jgi:hypothetical protein